MTRLILIALTALALTFTAAARTATPHDTPRDITHYNLEKNRPAIQGYDPVAFFPEAGGRPLKGDRSISHTHRGVSYLFASRGNLDRFIENPARYEPAYGGWCASAMADGGRKVEIDPKNFKVTDGRLFLFYKSLFTDALDYWNKDEPTNIRKADEHWKRLTGE